MNTDQVLEANSTKDSSFELQARNILLTALVSALVALGANSAYYLYRGWVDDKSLEARRDFIYKRDELVDRKLISFMQLSLQLIGHKKVAAEDEIVQIISERPASFI